MGTEMHVYRGYFGCPVNHNFETVVLMLHALFMIGDEQRRKRQMLKWFLRNITVISGDSMSLSLLFSFATETV